MPEIYDCFAFFNELELLEIRLNELAPVVDHFVLVEATRTFQKESKPLYYQENKHLFKQFEDKIIHIVVDEYPTFFSKFRIPTTWDYDDHQKNQIKKGLLGCRPDDILIISDLDEIPNPALVKESSRLPGIKIFEQDLFYYYMNCRCIYYDVPSNAIAQQNKPEGAVWRGSVMLNFKDFTNVQKARRFRDFEGENITVIKNGGWHFSYVGGIDKIIKKIESLAHPEYNSDFFKDASRIEQIINSGLDIFDRKNRYAFVPVNDKLPVYLLNNIVRFANLVKA